MTTVTLFDGAQVDSSSEAWRHESEARMVARMRSTQQRHEYIEVVARQRGADAAASIRTLATRIRLREVLHREDA